MVLVGEGVIPALPMAVVCGRGGAGVIVGTSGEESQTDPDRGAGRTGVRGRGAGRGPDRGLDQGLDLGGGPVRVGRAAGAGRLPGRGLRRGAGVYNTRIRLVTVRTEAQLPCSRVIVVKASLTPPPLGPLALLAPLDATSLAGVTVSS